MKYIYVLLIACLVILLGCIGHIRQPIKGDVNCDRKVSITDLVILHRHVELGTHIQCPNNGDMNRDFKLDMKDVEELRDILAGIK